MMDMMTARPKMTAVAIIASSSTNKIRMAWAPVESFPTCHRLYRHRRRVLSRALLPMRDTHGISTHCSDSSLHDRLTMARLQPRCQTHIAVSELISSLRRRVRIALPEYFRNSGRTVSLRATLENLARHARPSFAQQRLTLPLFTAFAGVAPRRERRRTRMLLGVDARDDRECAGTGEVRQGCRPPPRVPRRCRPSCRAPSPQARCPCRM